ncbi:MAG: YihY/virulence factor BrkB family protein [Sphingobacteriales bacterium]|nr:MAG: YihY/virulence factor BrkB family protein [Sphingobacteriales bacterium]
MIYIKKFWNVLKKAAASFIDDNGMKLSASLSYYTIFSLCPILIIIMSLAGVVFGKDAVQGRIYDQISGLVGSDAAIQVQEIIINIEKSQHGTLGAIVGAVLLIFGATGVFTEIQDSINYIWSVKAKPKKGWLKYLSNRAISFSLLVGIGFVLLVALVINALMDILNDRLEKILPSYSVYLFYVLSLLLILVIISLLFTIIYKVLPDAIIAWKDAMVGAIFTTVLFLIGKFLIGYYLGNSNIGLTYGTAASIVIILLWVYYSSIILYFGAEFTRMYAIHIGKGIKPNETAVFIIKQEAKEIPSPPVEK